MVCLAQKLFQKAVILKETSKKSKSRIPYNFVTVSIWVMIPFRVIPFRVMHFCVMPFYLIALSTFRVMPFRVMSFSIAAFQPDAFQPDACFSAIVYINDSL